MVPSNPQLTALIGLGMSIPVIGLAWIVGANAPQPPNTPVALLHASYASLWCLAGIVTATVGSRVIYGLRQEVREARRLGQYTLVEKIGEGGMGAVYKAHHALLRRPTAIKLLPPAKAGMHNLSRFEREVQMTSRLTHPNTVAIYDYGRTPDGIFYYAMEYLEGIDLQELGDVDGPQDPARVVHIMAQVCGALAEAHATGLVHRDIKPANIILCERGGVPDTAKVVDFGLVKELDASEDTASLALSGANTIMGTPLYLPPEAITEPSKVDGRSDLYAVGAVLYFLLTGSPVYEASTVVEVCAQHLHGAPIKPSERLGRPLPEDLQALVIRCLEKDPRDRPQTAAELRDALRACDVGSWSESAARTWWDRGRSDFQKRRRASSGLRQAVRQGSVTVAIDLETRALGETEVA
jgi:serine/threonine-protein kinase